MNIKNSVWLLLFLWVIAGIGCYDDKGSYDYSPVNQVEVTDGIETEYRKAVGDILEIIPVIRQTGDLVGDTARYEYWWTAQRELDREGAYSPLFVIGRGRSLYYQVDLPNISPDKYLLVFHMKDRESGIEWTRATVLEITGSLQQGWLLLCDKAGKAELNMYARKSDGSMVLVKDMLEKSGFPYLRGPRQVSYEDNSNTLDGHKIWILTDEATGWLTKADYQWKDNQLVKYKMVTPVSSNYTCRDIVGFNGVLYLIEDEINGGGFQAKDFRSMGSIFGGNIAVYNKGASSFKVAPYVGANFSNPTINGGILYDTDHLQFVWCPIANNTAPEEAVVLSGDVRWKVGKKMIGMYSSMKNTGIINALFEDPDVADVVWEYEMQISSRFDFPSMSFIVTPSINGVKKLEKASHLRNARLITYHMTTGFSYYMDGQTLYSYYGGEERVIKEFDEEVVLLHSQYVKSGSAVENMAYLVVATYKEEPDKDPAQWGNLHFYSVGSDNPTSFTLRNSVSGVGRVVDIDYQFVN